MNIILYILIFLTILTTFTQRVITSSIKDFYVSKTYKNYFELDHKLYHKMSKDLYDHLQKEIKRQNSSPTKAEKKEKSKKSRNRHPKRATGEEYSHLNLSLLLREGAEGRAIVQRVLSAIFPHLGENPSELNTLLNEMYRLGVALESGGKEVKIQSFLKLPPPYNDLFYGLIEDDGEKAKLSDYFILDLDKKKKGLCFHYTSEPILQALFPPYVYEKLKKDLDQRRDNKLPSITEEELMTLLKESGMGESEAISLTKHMDFAYHNKKTKKISATKDKKDAKKEPLELKLERVISTRKRR